ncbi:unnamed protein product [Rodentolepis nana]|uniref:Peptidase A1 domain-containing protein n=1 Tax=Rodentolepis nana TaxID=102285 RepID=A0A0R3TP64_RODNA|nr:unnamed protein product [Rodentolepis nana]
MKLEVVEDDQDPSLYIDSNAPQKAASKGGLFPSPPSFHCPANSTGVGCLADFLRLDITSSDHRRLRLEVCPYAQINNRTEVYGQDFKQTNDDEEEGEMYYGLATTPINSPIMTFGPIYNFTSIDFMVNLQLGGGPMSHLGVGNESEVRHHGWVKGLLFEYICKFVRPFCCQN